MNGVEVSDPFGVTADPAMPFLKDALDPAQANAELQTCALAGHSMAGEICAIHVRRYKPGRRCLIEYCLQTKGSLPLILLGKVRAKGTDRRTYQLVKSLWEAGFSADAPDGIAVPEPLGLVPRFNLWLQAKVGGQSSTDLLSQPGAAALGLARRIAEAAHKLHSTVVPTMRQHRLADELSILRDRLARVAIERPDWGKRLLRITAACEELGAGLPSTPRAGIHRDFYADHVLVEGARLWLLDFDLYCRGDPALDIGNFIAHLTEQSLRNGDSTSLGEVESHLENRYAELSGDLIRRSIRAYATFSLVRHIYISTLFPGRRPSTERLVKLCEDRLGLS